MNILDQIVAHKKEELSARRRRRSISGFRDMEYFDRGTISLMESVKDHYPMAVIAELKRSSPSAGVLREHLDPPLLAGEYERSGAAAISVITDERFFGGSLDDLPVVRKAVNVPVMRKDFIIDEYQIFEAKAHGADAVLLIAAILDKSQLTELFMAAGELRMESLVELYEKGEIDKLDFDRMKLVGINNRDLRTFAVDVGRTMEMCKLFPGDVTVVSESGITSIDHLLQLRNAGIAAALIGECLMKSPSPGETLRQLLAGAAHEASR